MILDFFYREKRAARFLKKKDAKDKKVLDNMIASSIFKYLSQRQLKRLMPNQTMAYFADWYCGLDPANKEKLIKYVKGEITFEVWS